MKIYMKLWHYLRPHLGLLGLACACMVVSSLFKGVSLGALVPLVDVVLLNRPVVLPEWLPGFLSSWMQAFQALPSLGKLHILAVVVAGLFLFKSGAVFAQTYFMNDVALRFLRDIRNGLYRHYQRLSLNFFTGEGPASLSPG